MRRIKIARKRKKEKKNAKCPNCNTIITCEGEPGQKIRGKCPNCGKESVIFFTKEKKDNFEKSKINFSKKKIEFRMPEKTTLSKIIWMLFLFFLIVTVLSLFFVAVTSSLNIQIFFVLILIGIIVLKELSNEFTPNRLKKKLNILISGLFIIFLLIVINDIIHFISR